MHRSIHRCAYAQFALFQGEGGVVVCVDPPGRGVRDAPGSDEA
jgi:hypothetical protein